MTTIDAPRVPAEQRLLLRDIEWATYERLVADQADRRTPRLTYDRGELEIVSPGTKHERDSGTLALLVELVAAATDASVLNVGSMTYKRRSAERGFEPDVSFYVGSEPLVRDKEEIDPEEDPPPDLVVEVDVTNPSLDKLSVFAGLGVPEVWRWADDRLRIYLLDAAGYREADRSAALPMLTAQIVTRFMAESRSLPRPAWLRSVTEWAEGAGTEGDGSGRDRDAASGR
jgi:Uma2 family endonuclease